MLVPESHMKIVWAVNPFDREPVAVRALGKLLVTLIKRAEHDVVPLYVSSRAETALNTAFEVAEEHRYTKYPEQILTEKLKQKGFPVLRGKVVFEDTKSLKAATERMIQTAVKEKADILAVSTHSRKGIKRLLVGSFAEYAISHSPFPLLVMNPYARVPDGVSKLMFASDLSKPGRKAFMDLLKIAKKWKCSVVFLHAPDAIYAHALDKKDKDVIKYQKYVDDGIAEAVRLAKDAGVSMTTVIDNEIEEVYSLIMRQARRQGADILVTAAHSGTVKGAVLGSVTKQLIREAKLPILVMKSS